MSSSTYLKFLSPVLLGILLGCASTTRATANVEGVAGASSLRKQFKARYTMPIGVTDVDLKDVSIFDLAGYTVDLTNEAAGQAELEYQMPVTLLGYEKTVKLFMTAKREQTFNSQKIVIREFSGRDGSAICAGPWSKMRCEVKFAVVPDLKALQILLKESRDTRAPDRMEVARRFGNEPIGITEVE